MADNFNTMQMLKRRFFAMRNGLLADQLRRDGSKFRIIFGLNIIQLNEIARDYGHDAMLADALWHNTATRESMLLAPMLWSADDFDFEGIMSLCGELPDTEVADMVCHRLLKKRDDAMQIIVRLSSSDSALQRYTALRLALPLIGNRISAEKAAELAQNEMERGDNLTASLAAMVKSESDFLSEPDPLS